MGITKGVRIERKFKFQLSDLKKSLKHIPRKKARGFKNSLAKIKTLQERLQTHTTLNIKIGGS